MKSANNMALKGTFRFATRPLAQRKAGIKDMIKFGLRIHAYNLAAFGELSP